MTTAAGTYLHWDVVVHGSRQGHRSRIVREGPDHVQMPGHGAQKVQPQVTEGHDGVAKETQSLEGQDENTLVLLPLLEERESNLNQRVKNEVTNQERLRPQDTPPSNTLKHQKSGRPTVWLLYSALVAVSRMVWALWMKG